MSSRYLLLRFWSPWNFSILFHSLHLNRKWQLFRLLQREVLNKPIIQGRHFSRFGASREMGGDREEAALGSKGAGVLSRDTAGLGPPSPTFLCYVAARPLCPLFSSSPYPSQRRLALALCKRSPALSSHPSLLQGACLGRWQGTFDGSPWKWPDFWGMKFLCVL